ncbi:hypothetical protein PanWU01x14_352910 [Parasponia andersonii]|uniref:Uncharacterized protein n=1 Tax=Parasponia andersonii TaxID=3476 RepID=A0A2P5AA51_PARAD|nr:hypothetical protein PanWU01x14_352910 [Parasponia andersonii]
MVAAILEASSTTGPPNPHQATMVDLIIPKQQCGRALTDAKGGGDNGELLGEILEVELVRLIERYGVDEDEEGVGSLGFDGGEGS